MARRIHASSALFRTTAVLWWEQLYAAFVPFVSVCLLFVAVALFIPAATVPPWLHLFGLIGFGAGAIAAFAFGLRVIEPPTTSDALKRLEGDSALPRGTLLDLADQPFAANDANPLWQAHMERMRRRMAGLRLGGPRALIDRTDPIMLRAFALMSAVTGLVIAGDQADLRLAQALYPDFSRNGPVTTDIWVAPPAYTGLPPRFLVRSAAVPVGEQPTTTVPQNSTLTIRASRPDALSLRVATGDAGMTPARAEDGTITLPIVENMAVAIRDGRSSGLFPFTVVPDVAPAVRWRTDLSVEGGTRLILPLETQDDYSITDAKVTLRLNEDLGRGPDTPAPTTEAETTLPLAALHGTPGERAVSLDLTEHPWAGLPVFVQVTVTDGAGQSAGTEEAPIVLPTRNFYNPLARTVAEERQNLALAPASWQRSATLFQALTYAPEAFADSAQEYLLLRTAYHDLVRGEGENIEEVVETFWPLAISLEDEGLALARQRLEAAQAALREALARGAPQEEIDRLLADLKEAMDNYIAALAQSGDAMAAGDGSDTEDMNTRDLDDILAEIAELQRQGDSAAARQRLSELEQMLQNLRISPGSGSGEGEGQAGQSGDQPGEEGDGGSGLNQAGELIDQQRRLSDDTFSARRGDQSGNTLSDRQRDLSDAAEALAEQARQNGNAGQGQPSEGEPGSAGDPSGSGEASNGQSGEESFNRAAEAMRRAADALAQGDLATGQLLQEQALSLLREGASALAEQALAEQAQDREGAGASQPGDNGSVAGSAPGRDPLGRRYENGGRTGIDIPDLGDPERVRELTDRLRERLSLPNLSEAERKYIERLLERF